MPTGPDRGPMERRLVVLAAVALTATLAGCSAPGSLAMEPVDDAELARQATVPATAERGSAGEGPSVVQQAVLDGTATVVAEGPPVDTDRPVRAGGRVYRLAYEVTGTEPARTVELRVNGSVSSDEVTAPVRYGELPAVDRRLLDPVTDGASTAPAHDRPIVVGETLRTERYDRSALATGRYDAVRRDGALYGVTVLSTGSDTLARYRYRATAIAPTLATYGRQVRERHAFTLANLSAAQREVVAAAIEGSYYAEDDDEAFASLAERFRGERPVTGSPGAGTYVVRYDGRVYWTEASLDRVLDGE